MYINIDIYILYIQAARLNLPVCGMEQEIVEAITLNDVVILCGETGSGKSTQGEFKCIIAYICLLYTHECVLIYMYVYNSNVVILCGETGSGKSTYGR
jgi:HrpA-like RNA helicase